MDLLAPCRSCLQCLPFFHDSPPSSPRLASAPPSSSPESQEALLIATPTDPSHSSENLQCSIQAAAMQEQDLPLIGKEEEPQDTKYEKDDSLIVENTDTQSSVADNEATAISEIIIAPPVSAASDGAYLLEDTEPSKSTVPSELPLHVPFINDISFSTSGLMHLPSPITPAAFGAGYPAGQYYPPPQIYQAQHLAHVHSHHGHDNSHHGHDHALHGHDSSHHGHDYSHHGHDNSHNGFDHSHHGPGHDHDHDHSHHGHAKEHGHVNIAPLDAVSLPHPPSDLSEFVHEYHEDPSHANFAPLDAVSLPRPPSDLSEFVHEHHKDPSHCDLHQHGNDGPSMDEAPPHSQCDNSVTEHSYLDDDHHDQTLDSAPLPTLEPSQSMQDPDNVEVKLTGKNGGADVVSNTNGASAGLLEAYHSEPIGQLVTPDNDAYDTHDQALVHSESQPGQRRRRRDHFKDQFKGITQQIKQGGHLLKEEGSKQVHHLKEEASMHVQTIISNVNKQAQQIEQSGSFFNVPL